MTTATPEKYLPPKHLSAALCEQFGLCLSEGYIRAIRRASLNDGIWIAGCARPSEVLAWLRTHPDFSQRAPGKAGVMFM